MSKKVEEKGPKQYTFYGQKKTLSQWAKICQLPQDSWESSKARLAERVGKGSSLKSAMLDKNTNEEGVAALEKIKTDFQAANPTTPKGERKPVEMECMVQLKSGLFKLVREKNTSILAYKGKSDKPEKNAKAILKLAVTEHNLKFEKPSKDYNTRQLGVRVITALNEAGK